MTLLRPSFIVAAALAATATLPAIPSTTEASGPRGFEINWFTIDCGGGSSTGAGFTLTGTIGQHDAGPPATGPSFELTGGFSAGMLATCREDIDGDGMVGYAEVVAILVAWGNKGGPEDIDGDGTVGYGDILRVLVSWGPCL